MQQPIQSPPRLLVLEDDEELRTIVVDVLTEEGYAVTGASSLEEALAQVNIQVFALILADVIDWTAHTPLQAVERLKSQAHPMPVGLITGWNLSKEVVKEKGFVCLIKKPFDLNDLLTLVAQYVARPLTPDQERQAKVVQRYCQAIDAHDWQACAALCSDHVRYYPSPNSLFDRKQEVIGRSALLEQFDYNARVAPDIRYTTDSLFGRPDGIAVRYLATIATPEGRRPLVGSILFQVEGEQIVQIGYRLDAEHLRMWSHVQQKQPS